MIGSAGLERSLDGNLVLMCSGQGSQRPGMGAGLMDEPEVAETFECASDVLKRNLRALVEGACAEELDNTRNAQVAICALSVGIGRLLMGRGLRPAALLGFSLGQVSAMSLAGMMSLEQTFALVDARSQAMADAAQAAPGCMTALLRADEPAARALCEQCAQGDVLVPANYNCPGQIVISGTVAAIERAEEAWASQGKRFSRLATSGAFHSPLMQPAACRFAAYLETVSFAEPRIPVICNTDAAVLTAAEARERLVRHLTQPVLFQQSVSALANAGARCFVEAGYGGVLTNLVRRIDKGLERACVQDAESLSAFMDAQAGVSDASDASGVADVTGTPSHVASTPGASDASGAACATGTPSTTACAEKGKEA